MGGNERAALAAVVMATGPTPAGRQLCAALLDIAAETLNAAPADVLALAGGGGRPHERLAAMATLTELCAACRACPRGARLAAAGEEAHAPVIALARAAAPWRRPLADRPEWPE